MKVESGATDFAFSVLLNIASRLWAFLVEHFWILVQFGSKPTTQYWVLLFIGFAGFLFFCMHKGKVRVTESDKKSD